jgi:hypothetical protein
MKKVSRHSLLLPLWILTGLVVQRPAIADPLITVYAQATYTQAELEVLVFADIVQTNLLSFAVNVGYDPSDLSVIEAQKNEQTWYFGAATTTYPYKDPDTSTAGSVLIIGGKLDVGDPTAGVTGNATLLGRVLFARESASIPSISLSLGIADAFDNFVATDGTVMEDQTGQLIFSPVTVVAQSICPDGQDKVIENWTYSNGQFTCTADGSITAGSTMPGPVTVSVSAEVTYDAPTIILTPIFRVEAGGIFHARNGSAVGSRVASPGDISNDSDALAAGDDPGSGIGSTHPLEPANRLTVDDLPQDLLDRLSAAQARVSDLFTDAAGRQILFATEAGLVAEDDNGLSDVYLYDSWNETLRLVSIALDGAAADGPSTRPRMNGMATRVVYQSRASNLVEGDTNGVSDIFLYDTETWLTERVSWTLHGLQAPAGAADPAVDAEGDQILYDRADAPAYRHIYGYDPAYPGTDVLSIEEDDTGRRLDNHHPGISADGRYIVYLESTHVGADGDQSTCAVHFYDQQSGGFARVPCPDELADGGEYIPYFDAQAQRVDWIEEADPVEVTEEPAFIPHSVAIDNPLLLERSQ